MGIDVRMETENGEELGSYADPRGLVTGFLPKGEDERFVRLRYVDPYGDTTINQLQLPQLVREQETILGDLDDGPTRSQCEGLLALARRACDRVHTYVKFCGD